jgi:two-component system nitrogen regulation sensor histidine kinase NtrY
MESQEALPLPPTMAIGRGWLERMESRPLIGAGYAVSAALTATAVGLGSSPTLSGPMGPASPLVLTLLGVNLVLILALGVVIGRRLLRLVAERGENAGARLHFRFVALFAAAAVVPALIIALFFGVLVTRGIESWFSNGVQSVIEESAKMARSYLSEQADNIRDHTTFVARDLNSAGPSELAASPVAFSQFLAQQSEGAGFVAAYVVDRRGRVLATAHSNIAPPFLTPPEDAYQAADQGDLPVNQFEHADLFRALYRLRAFPDDYLYVVWPVDPGVFSHLRITDAKITDYRVAKANRTRIEFGFFVIYLETVLWVLLASISLAMSAASSLSAPIGRLVQAAGRVAGGDLSVRLDPWSDPEEIAVLSRAFNSMTDDLEAQRLALVGAHAESESRRQFIETMLFGVSAGVIGLDAQGRISVVNRQAAALLELHSADLDRPLRELVPEFQSVVDRAGGAGIEIEEDVDVVRGGESRRLRLRIGHSPDGLVLTFDDITRLVAAQRNAAWKDVARRIAHEIKNPLTPIQLSAERIRRKYRAGVTHDLETFDRCTETIIRQVGDIGRMVDEFSAFARMPAPKFAIADAAELLRQGVFAQRVADPETTIEIAAAAGPVEVLCDARMIGQALTNLLKNAGEAIVARRSAHAQPPGHIHATLHAAGGFAVIDIEDNGVGLPAKDRDRLTEPYVTTREKGTGLGLAIVERIMEEHGGELTLADAARAPGARVSLRLPLAHAAAAKPAAAAPALRDA